jgi:17beta-estradiol 17-dehydrogenase / very-long-chain 3-oxoacyl-CoA reductase
MTLVHKIGCIALVLWGYQISLNIINKLYRSYFSINNTVDLSSLGKWAIVTGCSRGIGKAFVEVLAKQGLNVILVNDNSQAYKIHDRIKDIAENLKLLYNIKTKIIYVNLVDGVEAYQVIEKEIIGLEIGILINNFGQCYPHPEYFLDLPCNDKIYMNIVQCNIVVTTNMCRIILPQMVLRQKGVIVNVASSAAVIPSPLLTVYAATKAYVLKFSTDLHIEYNKYGIIVQCLLPANVTNSSRHCSKTLKSWISPNAEEYVENAIKTIGQDEITTGFFPHTMFIWIVQLIYKLSPTLLIFAITRIMEINRYHAIQKYVY